MQLIKFLSAVSKPTLSIFMLGLSARTPEVKKVLIFLQWCTIAASIKPVAFEGCHLAVWTKFLPLNKTPIFLSPLEPSTSQRVLISLPTHVSPSDANLEI